MVKITLDKELTVYDSNNEIVQTLSQEMLKC